MFYMWKLSKFLRAKEARGESGQDFFLSEEGERHYKSYLHIIWWLIAKIKIISRSVCEGRAAFRIMSSRSWLSDFSPCPDLSWKKAKINDWHYALRQKISRLAMLGCLTAKYPQHSLLWSVGHSQIWMLQFCLDNHSSNNESYTHVRSK